MPKKWLTNELYANRSSHQPRVTQPDLDGARESTRERAATGIRPSERGMAAHLARRGTAEDQQEALGEGLVSVNELPLLHQRLELLVLLANLQH